MTDNPVERIRKVNDDIAAKNRWLSEIRRRTDNNGQISAEDSNEARRAAGLVPLPLPEAEQVPVDLHAQIREAERVGDVARSIALKRLKQRTHR